jgi:L-threonylcarbamoyladenylate synthase
MLNKAVKIIERGGVVIYPTETLYAIGCAIRSESAVERVARFKYRDETKPFPVIVGSREQLSQVTAVEEGDATRLMEAFWPGPLSILVPAQKDLPSRLTNSEGLISLRWTPHPDAQALCRMSGTPLLATSANTSGRAAVSCSESLEQELISQADWVLRRPCSDQFRLPSTVVRPLDRNRVLMVREGAIPASRLREAGIEVELDMSLN